MAAPTPLALIELYAGEVGGHWPENIVALARAATERQIPTAVVAINGIAPSTRAAVEALGAHVVTRPGARDPGAWVLLAASRGLRRLVALARRMSWRVRYQWELAERCLAEAASLRIASRWARPARATTVILTAGETLHGTVAALSRVAHIRVVHDVQVWEGPVLSRVERALAARRRRVVAVCTTAAVRDALVAPYAGLSTVVRALALSDSASAIAPAEREPARAALGIGADEAAAALVGGWLRYKDIAAVADALEQMTRPMHLVVAGHPLDEELLERMRRAAGERVHVLSGPLEAREIREVYAAADVTIVSRRPGVAKASALVFDALRYRVPLVVSDSDPALSALLAGRPWARTFAAGDGAALAAALDAVVEHPLERPGPADAAALDVGTGEDALALLIELQAGL